MIVSLSAPLGRRGERVEMEINTPGLLPQLREGFFTTYQTCWPPLMWISEPVT
jgi:hypothetical protein